MTLSRLAEPLLESAGAVLLALLAALLPLVSRRIAPALVAWLEAKLRIEPCASCGARRRKPRPKPLRSPG